MSGAPWRGLSAIFLGASALFFVLGNYYLYVMSLELRSKLPESQWNSPRAWLSPLPLHREHCPDSPTRLKCLMCAVAMLLCGYVAFLTRVK
ncbi:MAG: hypothetical protein LAO08_09795 [Acidobacteriia bacterium]|nr:hypothetical protein [Terriglobia bacterium]